MIQDLRDKIVNKWAETGWKTKVIGAAVIAIILIGIFA
tara:strand:- start:622 stop:735 length:114 start_codon:yes stop_codon:yes gene_type:complete